MNVIPDQCDVFWPIKKIDVSGYPTDPKFLLPTLKILSYFGLFSKIALIHSCRVH
jgi:hypothetical protein